MNNPQHPSSNTMFTIADLERAKGTKSTGSILDAILFSVQKNEFAYVMNLCNSHDRGHYTEKMVQNKLMDYGLNVDHRGESCDYDLLIGENLRAEVKLATVQRSSGSNRTQYVFHKIKPECFDVLFLVFLNPYGTTIKWTTSEMCDGWSKEYGIKRGKNGYQARFNDEMVSHKLVYNEKLELFVRLYHNQTRDLCLTGA